MRPTKFELALSVRKKLEIYAEDMNYAMDLCGLCALGSGTLHVLFKKFKYRSIIVWGLNKHKFAHCFVESDRRIWDVTATQFDKLKHIQGVHSVKRSNPYYQKNWYVTRTGLNYRDIFPKLIKDSLNYWFRDWDDSEIPSYSNITKVLKIDAQTNY